MPLSLITMTRNWTEESKCNRAAPYSIKAISIEEYADLLEHAEVVSETNFPGIRITQIDRNNIIDCLVEANDHYLVIGSP